MTRSRTCRIIAVGIVLAAVAVPALPATARIEQPTPNPRIYFSMAYDRARGEVVLFGGSGYYGSGGASYEQTWTWDGSAWTLRHPAHSPSVVNGAGMVYDAAREQVLLFGGEDNHGPGNETWTWDGADWTRLTPSHAPSPRGYVGMADDEAHDRVVLFGGYDGGFLGDTWTWDGSDWRLETPAHSPVARPSSGMAYDAARRQVVLFGGAGAGDTWVWNGADWSRRQPVHSPSARGDVGMTYDAARRQVVLFGGLSPEPLDDTWTWDGVDWTQHAPQHVPPARGAAGMAFDDAIGQTVLFGGFGFNLIRFADTWTWDGSDWAIHLGGSVKPSPHSGSPGESILVMGWGFAPGETVRLTWIDSGSGSTPLGSAQCDASGQLWARITVPAGASPGRQRIKAKGHSSGETAAHRFFVE